MSEKMTGIPYEQLLYRVCREYETRGTIFGVSHIYKAGSKRLPIFTGQLETPFGPAAGPNTQLAQNIIAAYAAGSRFFELKTVQIMDGEELAACISRPCIKADDEGYNCEWSTELTVPAAMDEYIKAWKVLKVISEKYGLGSPDGFVFNMSVGYNLDGIRSEKIDAFIEGLRAAGVSDSVTISTLHGCPPDEIERIADYLIGEKGLNTFIKCNPTLLGYDFARKTLDELGYGYIAFDDHHFLEDLQWADAVPMFRRLQALAGEKGVEFGLKLTNTFPVDVRAGELPSEEMYMSGRALFPLTIELARRISAEFDGALRISYSGGADVHSAAALFRAGIWPITMATNVLRPGGYNRMEQIASLLDQEPYARFAGVSVPAVTALAAGALTDPWYRKPIKPVPSRKIPEQVPLMDCFFAPCREGCPIHQDIPAYIRLVNEGKYLQALELICERNPLPNITGTICAHPCMSRCTRSFYDGAVDIRGCKLEATSRAYGEFLARLARADLPAGGKKVAVVGAGPAGLAGAYFLARCGCSVTVFEKTLKPGGIVRHVIPPFRISTETVEKDAMLCAGLGVKFRYGTEIRSAEQLTGFDDVLVCTGAWIPGPLPLEGGQARDVLEFLSAYKKHPLWCIPGRSVAVIGGGNTAMDVARAAKRCTGVKKVTLVYRRDMRSMPADEEELKMALDDGVEFRPLLSPVAIEGKKLKCEKMVLGEPDASGRRSPVATGEYEYIDAACVIAAVGERTDTALYQALGIPVDEKGRAIVGADGMAAPHIYLAGDGASGPSTIVQAIAGAARAARAIAGADFEKYAALNAAGDPDTARARKGVFPDGGPAAERCLECATVCENCVDVCPNRANVSLVVDGRIQILHLDWQCNECGNCATFCPWSSAPYRDKWTMFADRESFEQGPNQGFLPLSGLRVLVRFGGREFECDLGESNGELPPEMAKFTRAALLRYPELELK